MNSNSLPTPTLLSCPAAFSETSDASVSTTPPSLHDSAPVLSIEPCINSFATNLDQTPSSAQINPNHRLDGVRSTLPSPSSDQPHCRTPCATPRTTISDAPPTTSARCPGRVLQGPPRLQNRDQDETFDESSHTAGETTSTSKSRFVNGLVGACVLAIDSIWGTNHSPGPDDAGPSDGSVLPLHWFVKEVLRRSRTSCSTLQVALFYLHQSCRDVRHLVALSRSHRSEFELLEKQLRSTQPQPALDASASYPSPPSSPLATEARYLSLLESQTSPLLCGRRMFLAALICASKFLQDRNYSNRAWAKISGLGVAEINVNERAFLGLVNYRLYVGPSEFHQWTLRLAAISPAPVCAPVQIPTEDLPTPAPVSLSTSPPSHPVRLGITRSSSTPALKSKTLPPSTSLPITPPASSPSSAPSLDLPAAWMDLLPSPASSTESSSASTPRSVKPMPKRATRSTSVSTGSVVGNGIPVSWGAMEVDAPCGRMRTSERGSWELEVVI